VLVYSAAGVSSIFTNCLSQVGTAGKHSLSGSIESLRNAVADRDSKNWFWKKI